MKKRPLEKVSGNPSLSTYQLCDLGKLLNHSEPQIARCRYWLTMPICRTLWGVKEIMCEDTGYIAGA